MDSKRKRKIEEFWKAKTILTAALFSLAVAAFLFIMTDRLSSWIPWLFIASAVAVVFFDLRKGVCPFCLKLVKTASLGKGDRFRFCPHCGESLVVEG